MFKGAKNTAKTFWSLEKLFFRAPKKHFAKVAINKLINCKTCVP
jgi:hypothetical protein